MPAPQGMLAPFEGMDLGMLGGFDPSKLNLPNLSNLSFTGIPQENKLQSQFDAMGRQATATQARTDAMIDRLPQVQAQGPVAPQSFKPLTPRPGESASSPSFMLAQQRQMLDLAPANPFQAQSRLSSQPDTIRGPMGIGRLSEGPANYTPPPMSSWATQQIQPQLQQLAQQQQRMATQQRQPQARPQSPIRPPQQQLGPQPRPQARPEPNMFQQAMSYVKPVTQGFNAIKSLFSLF